ncbi:hypothetical protein [Actinophytocola sp. NPDC049390]|uniref:hypothetical protein n=1 Tax=Actinophytocola sp. NPDC049390 TaxID=3363894 RepID=UPI0037B938EF
MKRLGTVVGAGVLLLLASACANPQESQEPGTGSTTTAESTAESTAPSTTPDRQPARTPPSGGAKVPTAQIDDSSLPKGYPQLVWTEDEGTSIGVVAQEGGCGKASVEIPEQSDKQVVVLMVETIPAKPQACTMDLRYPKITSELDAPLGDRTVVLKSEQRKA